ncbi:MAG TPA: class I SAM-dependent methyltransferase [Actinophytocola sp.]|nr:class I SAM-dependent methyltransferase [Actinophytocola sp.]
MNKDRIDVSELDDDGITWTLLGTLYLRAWESRLPQPILGDHHAAEAVDRIDYDFATLAKRLWPQGNQFLVALRAKRLDEWGADFLTRHPDATVLQLGCGLDSRMLRLAPPAGVRWFDLDVPKVVEVRRRLFAEPEGYHLIGASVTDPDWLGEVPADRPVLVIAEGLFPYLDSEQLRVLLHRLTDRFDTGELIFDAVAPWITRVSKPFRWGTRDGREIERWNPRLRCLAREPFATGYRRIPIPGYRRLFGFMNATPGLRKAYLELRFGF